MSVKNFNRLEAVAYAKGYRVTEDGRLLNPAGRQLAGAVSDSGYPRFRYAKKSAQVFAHRLAAYQQFGDSIYVEGIECRHRDNNRTNFRPDNITLGTHSQNMMDQSPEQRRAKALKAAAAIKRHEHGSIIAFYLATKSYRETCSKFGIGKSTLHFILNRSDACKAIQQKEAA